MASSDVNPPGNILAPTVRALQYGAMINGQSNKLIDYYVEATDSKGNVTRTDIQHVWVGGSTTPPPTPGGGAFVMDGALDADAKEIATRNGMHLYYSMHAGKLYLATNDAGEGSDHFIYLAGASGAGAMVPANWAKAGQIAQWAAFLADENDNDYEAWSDAAGANQAATGANGGVLEGTIDLAGEFGSIPSDIYLAVGLYGTANAGALLATHQLPTSLDNDGNIQAVEYLKLTLPIGWALGGGGDWNTDWNWADFTPNGVGSYARFLNTIATPSTVTTDVAKTVGQITFASPYGYTIGGTGSLTFDVASGSSTITVLAGINQIALPTTLNDNTTATLSPATILRFNGPLHLAGNVTLTTSGGSTEINGAVTATAGAKFRVNGGSFTANVDLNGAALQIDAGEARLHANQQLSSLSVAGRLDVNDNWMIISSGDVGSWNGSAYTGLTGLIQSGRGDGPWNGATGLFTSQSNATSGVLTTLAIAHGSDVSGDSPLSVYLDPSDVAIMYTWGGDANLDGQLNGDDYFAIDSHVLQSGAVFGFHNGDFDYNGEINGDDYFILDSNILFAQSSGGPPGLAAIPEPTALALLSLAMPLLGRMRRCAR